MTAELPTQTQQDLEETPVDLHNISSNAAASAAIGSHSTSNK